VIEYTYDQENRLVRKGDIAYTYDKDGNLLKEEGLRRKAEYGYNGLNRMVYSEVTSVGAKSRVNTSYGYDGAGRRTVVQDAGGERVRTLYDGLTFEVIREGTTFTDGGFTTRFASGPVVQNGEGTEGSRYRWIGEEEGGSRTRVIEGESYQTTSGRYTGSLVTLYGKGEAVALNRSASIGTRGGAVYLG
jgi:YD repeat-containing protein